jgi:serine/threonine protein phosphatase PrpC
MKFSVFQLSRKGGRDNNEDRMGYCYTSGSALFLLADGMGGHPQGEVAADLALQMIAALFQKEAKPELPDVGAFLTAAVLAAHQHILQHAARKKMSDTPRTTIVAAVVQAGAVSWIHCGDSRFYMVRQETLLVRTRDHSFAERRIGVAAGKRLLKPLNRHVLFTCLGSPIKPVFELTGPVALLKGDRLLLCSDGLWNSLPDADITLQLGQKPVSEAVPALVESALIKAGNRSDNVTAIAMEWETPDAAVPTLGRVSTDTVRPDFFESTVHGGLLELDR